MIGAHAFLVAIKHTSLYCDKVGHTCVLLRLTNRLIQHPTHSDVNMERSWHRGRNKTTETEEKITRFAVINDKFFSELYEISN